MLFAIELHRSAWLLESALENTSMKTALMGIVSACLGTGTLAAATSGPAVPAYVTAAVTDPARPAKQIELDPWRKPAEVITFAGIEPGDRIADFMSGNAYFTRIFSRIVGPKGRVYAFLPAQELANCPRAETAGTRALERDERYRNVHIVIGAADRFAVPESLDVVWTAQNYHDLHDKFMAPTNIARLDAAIFRALRPGGVFLVIDHVAAPGSGLRDTETLHRIDPEAIRSEVTAAGFVFESQSEALRNPADSHSQPVFEPSIRYKTDQVILKFRKPLAGTTTRLEPAQLGLNQSEIQT
jgi:predicted methyltransferase